MRKRNARKKILIIVGTRPEVIKMAPVVFALKKSNLLKPILLSTGQHREMLKQSLRAFHLRVDHDLKLMRPDQNLSDLTANVLKAVYKYCVQTKPDAVLLQGDTTTVFASAIAAFYLGIPIGHVEAGLRTKNMLSPWPEEMNRRLVSPLCRWNFCPTKKSCENLKQESIVSNKCYITGNTVIDALLWMKKKSVKTIVSFNDAIQKFGVRPKFCKQFLMNYKTKLILVTGHRRESFGKGFENICKGILQVMRKNPNVGLIYPVHLNPNVKEPVNRLLGSLTNVQLIEPVGYELFVWLMNRCTFILTDSGGVQEESPSLGKPVLVMRDTTERPEGISAGTSQLVGSSSSSISKAMRRLLQDHEELARRSGLTNPYGDGRAAQRICKILENEMLKKSNNQ